MFQRMKRCTQITTILLLAVLFISGGGCGRFSTSSVDEEKEAHYLAGKNRLYSHDFEAAKAAFEKSLLVIPQSAAAHLELGLLNYEQFENYAQAIHHFERMLEFRPDHPVAERIKDQIQACKLALASEVTLPPVNKRIESEMKRLIQENEGLTNVIGQLRTQIVKLKDSLARKPLVAAADSVEGVPPQAGQSAGGGSPKPQVARDPQPGGSSQGTARQSRMFLKHVLKSGETFYSLARRYRLDHREIQKVNPNLRPTALKIGQVVNIPLSQTASAR